MFNILRRLGGNSRGFALEATLLVLLLISVLVAAAVLGTLTTVRTTSLDYRNSRVFYAAEASTDAIMGQLAMAMEDGNLADEELDALKPPDLEGFSFDSFSVTKTGSQEIETITDGPFAGLYSLTQKVEIFSEARDPLDNASAILISAKAQAIPIFQFGVFFEKDLEATNGPAMEFAGWVHSNGNIYLSSRNAWYRDAVTTPNKVFHDRKDNHNVYNGVYIDDAYGTEVKLLFDSRTHSDPNAFRARSDADFDNRLKTDAYGVDSLEVPLPPGMDAIEVIRPREAGDTEMEQRAKFSWKADMYVEVNLKSLPTKAAVCGSDEGSKTPDEVIGNPGATALQPVEANKNVVFKITLSGNCGDVSGGTGEIRADGAVIKTVNLKGSCTVNVKVPASTDRVDVVVTNGTMSDGTPFSGTATWKDLQSLVAKTTSWPQITVTRPADKSVPAPADMCSIFQWQWANYFDGREKNMRDVLNVNVAGLAAWAAGDAKRQAEMIYVEFDVPSGLGGYSQKTKNQLKDNSLDPSVRVINATVLPSQLTIATDYPLYVRGDFNKTDWKPAALVGDAITILSTAWNDAEHQVQVVEKKNAKQTEVWAAILAGHSATPCDHEEAGCSGGYSNFYGGGIENYPRFLEKWSNIKFIYRGSLVSLNEAQQAVGTWNGTYYSPPKRDWQFDTRFEDPTNLPPGTPVVGVVIRTAFRPVY